VSAHTVAVPEPNRAPAVCAERSASPSPSSSVKLSRDLRVIPVDKYRLPRDGRKWKGAALQRMQLAEWLSTYGDGDGSRIYPSVQTMCDHFGLSRATIFRLLADLKDLGLLEDEKNEKGKSRLAGECGTRMRRMNEPAFLGCAPQPAANTGSANVVQAPFEAIAGVSDSKAGVSDSRAGVSPSRDTTVTCTATGPASVFELVSVTGVGRSKSSSSAEMPDDDPAFDPEYEWVKSRMERLIEEARTILVRTGASAPHVVDAGLSVIEERSDYSGTVPVTANYFVSSFRAAMEDCRDKEKILKRAERRERLLGATIPEALRNAADIKRESQASGLPMKTVVEERLRARVAAGAA
jgi:hypothetical protein